MSVPLRRFLFLLSSTRRNGNSEQLAQRAARHLPARVEQQWLHLIDYPLPDFVDLRHDASYPPPAGNSRLLLEATLAATDLVLVAPLYWYTLPVPAKHYLDYWSAWMRTPEVAFRGQMHGKTFWAVVASSGDQPEAQPLEDTLRLCAQYMGMHWGGFCWAMAPAPATSSWTRRLCSGRKYSLLLPRFNSQFVFKKPPQEMLRGLSVEVMLLTVYPAGFLLPVWPSPWSPWPGLLVFLELCWSSCDRDLCRLTDCSIWPSLCRRM
jgi:NAD(P)H-dependent FMN reductase